MLNRINISNSLMKDFDDYMKGLFCGKLFRERHVLRAEDAYASSEAFNLGHWTEYMIAGGLPRSREAPLPDILKSAKNPEVWSDVPPGNPNENPDLPQELIDAVPGIGAGYRKMIPHILAFRKAFNKLEYTIIDTGVTWVAKTKEGVMVKGILDYLVEDAQGNPVIIDQKTSAKIDNKWDEMGWYDEFLYKRHKLLSQAVVYKWLGMQRYGQNIPFEFWVASTQDSVKRKRFRVKVSKDVMDRFSGKHGGSSKPDFVMDMMKQSEVYGWTPYPSPDRCADCPINHRCEFYQEVPDVVTITY